MTIYVKNMVCNRCVTAVKQEFEKLGLAPERVALGEVHVANAIDEATLARLDANLKGIGFERIDDRKARLIESIKNKVVQTIHHQEELDLKVNWSTYLSEALHYDYNHLSNLFSSIEGITLEQYIIKQKIEKVKELLFYDELTLSQIAMKLGYSSVAHLSAQFKKITGMTPSDLKKSREPESVRKTLDSI